MNAHMMRMPEDIVRRELEIMERQGLVAAVYDEDGTIVAYRLTDYGRAALADESNWGD